MFDANRQLWTANSMLHIDLDLVERHRLVVVTGQVGKEVAEANDNPI